MYCLVCKSKTDTLNITNCTDKRGRNRVKGQCNICGRNKSSGGSIDIHNVIGKLPRPKKGFVLPGYSYCGPFNPLEEQIDEHGNVIDKPRNELDKVCMEHDIDYSNAKSKADKHVADKKMLDKMRVIKPKTFREKVEKKVVQGVIGTKYKHGLSV